LRVDPHHVNVFPNRRRQLPVKKEDKGMDQRISAAIDVLLAKLDEQKRSVVETKKVINSLRQTVGEPPLFADAELQAQNDVGPSRPDLYYGKGPVTACREYLELRNRACSAEEIMKGLEQGAFDFAATGWKDATRARSIAMTLAKNSSIFHRLPNGTFGLLAWYPEVAKRKSEKQEASDKKDDSAIEENELQKTAPTSDS
jgi:hypothetical protein